MGLLKRKTRNRRLKRGHVLDVKLRSSQTRTARLRLAGMALMVTFCTLLALFLVWCVGEWVLNRLVYENQAFSVRRIEVATDGVIAPDRLRDWSGVRRDDNLLALDLARIKRDLELVPAIQSVQVERALPDTLHLVVVERKPVAKVIVPKPRGDDSNPFMTILLDAQGYVMLPVELRHRGAAPAQSDDNLPSISGLNPAQLVPGRRVESGQVRAALELLREFEMSDMVGLVDVERIDVSSPAILHVSTGQGNEVTFGSDGLPRQLRRWREIHERAQQFNKSIATLDLSVPNNIPVTLSEGPPRVPSRTGSIDHSNQRNRNV